jgi:putative ABC transport system permease protein
MGAAIPFPQDADTNRDGKLDAGEIAALMAKGSIAVPIIAVVPDFSFLPPKSQPADERIAPTLYAAGVAMHATISIKLKGQQIPQTLAAIDRLWDATHPGQPIRRAFMDQHMQDIYLDMLRQAQLFAVFAGIAIFLACFGLLGLAVSNTERRTKEIGIRKVLGADSGAVAGLLLWDFVKPVLWANLIAWPVAFYFLNRWLSGFAYHVALSPLVFVGATLLVLTVALLTVAVQSTLVARQRPVLALRYE